MNAATRLTALAIMMLAVLTSFQSHAQSFEMDGICYNILSQSDLTVEVTSGNEYSGDLVIPLCVLFQSKTYSVTKIGDKAFNRCPDLISISIPNSVTSIGFAAFCYCSGLTSITIPNSVTMIDYNTFTHCSGLTSVDIPNSVTTIGSSAFYDCTSLTSVTIPNSVTIIDGSAFYYCNSLTSVDIPNSVTTVGGFAFYGCDGLQHIYCRMEEPISCSPWFPDNVLENSTLYVPLGCKEKYEATKPWCDFRNIVEMDFAGVDEVAADEDEQVRVENGRITTVEGALTEVFDLQGRIVYSGHGSVVDNLPQGMYIVKTGSSITKIRL